MSKLTVPSMWLVALLLVPGVLVAQPRNLTSGSVAINSSIPERTPGDA